MSQNNSAKKASHSKKSGFLSGASNNESVETPPNSHRIVQEIGADSGFGKRGEP